MRLADDERGRVPFALIGVVLLVGSATFAATVETRGPSQTDRAVDETMDRVTASSGTALRRAIRDASSEAALHPVTAPANTTVGRALADGDPFRRSLRLRIYVRAQEYLRATNHERQGVRASASLPRVSNETSVERAIRSVDVEGVQNGTALRVTVRDISVSAVRNGRTVAAENRTVTVTVATPVLALHSRTQRFERRLNRGPLDGQGLGRRLTLRLFFLAWARGYAQHAGAPVENVVANRHVEVATNGGVLRTQRAVFGRADPAGWRGLRRATVRTGLRDVTAPTDVDVPTDAWPRRALVEPNEGAPGYVRGVPAPSQPLPVDVGRTADRAYVNVATAPPERDGSLRGALRDAYGVDARLETTVEPVRTDSRPSRPSVGDEWKLVDTEIEVDETVSNASGPSPTVDGDERVVAQFARRVERAYEVTWTWRTENRTRTERAEWTHTARVGVAAVVAYAPTGGAPDRPTDPLFVRGGRLNGSNLADTPDAAVESLITDRGGRDDVAADVVSGEARTQVTVTGEQPENLTAWARADVDEVRKRVRTVAVNVSGTEVASMRRNPPAELAARLRERRAAIVDAPPTYDGASDRARIAARARYFDRVLRALDAQAERFRTMRGVYATALRRGGVGDPDDLGAYVDAAKNANASTRRVVRGDLSNARLVPHGSPAYLTRSKVSHDRVRAVPPSRAYHPMATRNINVFTVPYGDAAALATGAARGDSESVSLAMAGRTLTALNRSAAASTDERLRVRRETAAAAVRGAMRPVLRRAERVLRTETSLSAADRRAAVARAAARWNGSGRRAQAAANGSLGAAVAEESMAMPTSTASGRERLAVRLRAATVAAAESSTVDRSALRPGTRRVRELAARTTERGLSSTGENATAAAAERHLGSAYAALPAGLPVLPPPQWYATMNVWTVTVRGAYARFSVRTRRDTSGGTLRYVRDGSTAMLDVDGDGDAERLGRSERVSFETRTAVFVVVPSKARGVGDVGQMVERSPGWPKPECTAPAAAPCPAE